MIRYSSICGRSGLATLLGLAVVLWAAAVRAADLPAIQSIHADGTNLVVTAHVPPGFTRLVLERRGQVGLGAWVPVAVLPDDGVGGIIEFRTPNVGDLAMLRVRADATTPLPSSFYEGPDTFDVEPASAISGFPYYAVALDATEGGVRAEAREVVESDIWRLHGDTLFFFNQYRGLQVIDIADPDNAELLGTLHLPAAGEQMYLLSPDYAVLLARTTCNYDESEILIVSVREGDPTIVSRLPLQGSISESRLVGSVLYVAMQMYRPAPGSDGSTWEWGTYVTSFDLADPTAPRLRSFLWFPGYGNVIHATDTYLFAVTQDSSNWQQSVVNVIDITDPKGTMRVHATLTAAGRVADKFKLDWSRGVLSVISEVSASPRLTKLETFRLSDPRSLAPEGVRKLGEVEVGHGERLFATRFDYPRVYIVTFLQIDPLWVVDLSNPATPVVSGELEVPGWSTYIHPMGDQLVAVGVETNRTTVSLFGVSDPSRPTLQSRVQLGSRYSYSEANQDEKAFNVIEDAGLILLPLQSYGTDSGAWVQLVDLGADTLTVRGRIEHDLTPRRATLHRDRIVSVSGAELLSVDASDRDDPQLTGALELAWEVNRVFAVGDYLIEITTGNAWSNVGSKPVVRVAPTLNPDDSLTTLKLSEAPVVGATLKRNRLYLAQVPNVYGESKTVLQLTVLDVSHLPELTVLGETSVTVPSLGWSVELQPTWPRRDLLVWVGGTSDYYWGWGLYDIAVIGAPIQDSLFAPYPQSAGGGRLLAFDVHEDTPKFLSDLDLTDRGWWGFSQAFTARGSVYMSHKRTAKSEVVGQTDPVRIDPYYTTYQRTFLDVIDYADPLHPTLRRPVAIPGTLEGISHRGALLYTVGSRRTLTKPEAWFEALHASAYDGVSAHLVDTLSLSNAWLHPVEVRGGNVFLGRAQSTYVTEDMPSPTLESWTLSNAGRFVNLDTIPLPIAISELVMFDDLLAAQVDWSGVQVFDTSNPATLRLVGEGPDTGCFNFDLHHADAKSAEALWLPMDLYGVTPVELAP